VIEFKNAAVGHGRRAVVSGIDWTVAPGAFVGVFGHNGSGKTTLIRTLLGLQPPLKGKVKTAGRLGYAAQKERLDPIYPLTAYQVAALGTYRAFDPFASWEGAEKALVLRCLADCGARDLAGEPFSSLSGGQKQRVLLARALACEPEILVVDEPLAGLDVATQRSLLDLLRRLKLERKLTVVMVSHRLKAEKDLFTDLVWVGDGKAVSGPAREMLARGPLADSFREELG
jgi:zinc/manganese transport system ATP-binding protein